MNKPLFFWIACSTILFALSLVWLNQGLARKNSLFTLWLLASVSLQLLAAWGLALHRPQWFRALGDVTGAAMLAVALLALALAAFQWQCPVNRIILFGLGGMLALQVGSRLLGDANLARLWTRNIGFFGPGLYMLLAFSGLRMDQLPLWISDVADSTLKIQDAAAAAAGLARTLLS